MSFEYSDTTALSNGSTLKIMSDEESVATDAAGNPQPAPIEYDVIRDDGQILRYSVLNGVVTSPPGVSLRLSLTQSGFTVTDDDDNVETYNANGALQSISSRAGVVQTVSYDSNGLFSGVTDSFGNTLSATRNGYITSVSINGIGSVQYTYGYNGTAALSGVTNLDGSTRVYKYDNASFPNAITALIDEGGAQLSTWSYDTSGRAISTQQAGGANAVTLSYGSVESATTTDALGAVRVFQYTQIGDIESVKSISGSQCPTCRESAATTYDYAGWVSSRTDYNGNVTCYANDPVRGLELARVEGFAPGSACPSNLTAYVPASGTSQRKISTTWSSTYRLPTQITEATRTTSFNYDSSGNLLTKTVTDTTVNPNVSRTWTYTYNSYGQVLTAQDPRTDVNSTTTYTYYSCASGAQCGQVQTVTDALGHVWTYNSYNSYGQPLTVTDSNGVATTLTYDARGRLTSRSTVGETTHFSYYPTGLLRTVTLADNSVLTYNYDGAHRLTQINDGLGNKIIYTLDAMGNRTAENTYDPSGTLHRTHLRVFNSLNELYQDVNAANTAAVTTTYSYDSNGNQLSVEAPLSRNTVEGYDALNRLMQITDPANGITDLSYDANDNLVAVTDPRSLVTSYSYDGFGDLMSQLSPDTGGTSNTYDSAGNLAASTDARGAVATYAYDALNRLTSLAYSLSGTTDQTISFAYDAGTNGKGHLTRASDANHSLTWSYDPLGRVISKSQTVVGVTKAVGYAYTNGDLTTLTTPSGQAIVYGYNTNHQVTSITVNGTVLLNNVTYEPMGGVNGWTWGNGTAVSRTYDTDQKITQISSAGTKTYSYDDAFRITGITDTETGASSWTYGYDLLDRLTSAGTSGTTLGWTYDPNGNRLTQTGTSPETYTVAGSSNRLASVTGSLARTYSYDAAGNVLGFSTLSFGYNNRGRMVSSTNSFNGISGTYIYNALGQVIEANSTNNGIKVYIYDEAGHYLGTYNNAGALGNETVWLGDIPVAIIRPSGSTIIAYYVHTDHLNTPRQVTRPSDNLQMWTWFSDPFGTAAANVSPQGATSFPVQERFPGQISTTGIGSLISNYMRDYDPAVGRYVESDPIGFAGGSYSTYPYVAGNPLRYIDFLGLKLCPVTLPGIGKTYLDDSFIPAVQLWIALNQAKGITLNFTEAFRTTAYQQSLTNNPNATTPATAGNSLHEAGYAVDISWKRLSDEQQDEVLDNADAAGLDWGGDFRSPDPVHFYHDPGKRKRRISDAQKRYQDGADCGCN